MRIIIIIIVNLLFSVKSYSQLSGLTNPITQTHNAYTNLISDFGPRYVTSGSKFHGAVDYDVQHTYDPAYCIENGEISFGSDDNMLSSSAFIQVGNWRYMHIHVGTYTDTDNNLVWELIKHEGQDKYILIISDIYLETLIPIHVYVPDGFNLSTFRGIQVERFANAGDLIFRARDYGTSGDISDHLHLDRGGGSWENPLNYLARNDNVAPTINYLLLKETSTGPAKAYSGNVVYGNPLIESYIQSTNEKDLDYIEFAVKPSNENYKKLFSWQFTGSNHMVVDRGLGTSAIPQNNIRQVKCGSSGDISAIQNNNAQGIFPINEYANGKYNGIPGKDIFKSNLIAENHTDPLSTSLQDGNYKLKVTVKDLGGNTNDSELDFTLDNFKPFIKKLEVHNILGNIVYSYEWKKEGSNLVLHEGGSSEVINSFLPVYIRFWTSEEITNPSVSFGGRTATFSTSSNDSYWQFECNSVTESSLHNVTISGTNKNRNAIFDMPQDDGQIALSDMPVRTGATFSNPGTPVETFYVVGCTPSTELKAAGSIATPDCSSPEIEDEIPSASFTYTMGAINNNIVPVSFMNTSNFGDIYDWDFGDTETSNESNPVHEFIQEATPRTYLVTLTVSNIDAVYDRISIPVLISGYNDANSSEPVVISGNYVKGVDNGIEQDYTFNYTVTSTNTAYSYSVYLDYGDGYRELGSVGANNEVHSYKKAEGTKFYYPTVNVEVKDGNMSIGSYQYSFGGGITIDALVSYNLNIEISQVDARNILESTPFELKAEVSNGMGRLVYTWTIANRDITSLDKNNPSHFDEPYQYYTTDNSCKLEPQTFDAVGEYLIKLNVFDQYGNYGYKEFIANVVSESGCATLNLIVVNCDSQWEVLANKPTLFDIVYNFDVCKSDPYGNAPDASHIFDAAGKIEWTIIDPDNNEKHSSRFISQPEAGPPVSSKCLVFPEAGVYKLIVKVTPYTYINGDMVLQNSISSTIIKSVVVKPYIDHLDISNFILLNYFSVDQRINGTRINSIEIENSTNPVNVASDFDISFVVNNEVTIKPGFNAFKGSDFSIKIQDDDLSSCSECSAFKDELPVYPYYYYDVPAKDITVSLTESWCDFGKGAYYMEFSVDNKWGGPYKGNLQAMCWSNDDCNTASQSGRYCNEYCIANTSFIYENNQVSYNYYGFSSKKKLYPRVRLSPGNGYAQGAVVQIGGMGIFKDADSIGYSPQNEYADILLYPNPTETQFTLEIGGDYTTTQTIEIFNKVGQMVFIKENDIEHKNLIDIQSWPEGVYFVRVITNEGKVEVKKLVKN